jgi:hypothetical protein
MSELYNRVAALDRGIADRWKAQTRDNPRVKLTTRAIDAIISPLLRNRGTITEKQAQAIVMLAQEVGFAEGALARLRFYVQVAEKSRSLDAQPLIGDAELSLVYDSLGFSAISRIIFKSPKSGITYTPIDYIAIQELIKQKKITVYQVKVAGLGRVATMQGEYIAHHNILFVYDGLSQKERTVAIVHEATHAIQDWRDVGSLAHHTEADAYVAEAIATHAVAGRPLWESDLYEAAFNAARFVIDRKAEASNSEWLRAYDDVVKAVGQTDIYKKQAGLRNNPTREESTRESTEYQAVLAAIDKRSQEFIEWGVDALKSTFGGFLPNRPLR